MTNKILIVDDEKEIREELIECFSDIGYCCLEASCAQEAFDIIKKDESVTIVLADIQMENGNGLDLIKSLDEALSKERELEFIVITGHGGTQEAIKALKLGVMDFLQKPIDLEHIIEVVKRAEELVFLKQSKRLYNIRLKNDVQDKTVEIRKLVSKLEVAYAEALDCLAIAAEFKDPETGNHIRRIGEYSKVIAKDLGWDEKSQEMIKIAAPLHDGGKIGTPEIVLLKPGPLNTEEVKIMKKHAELGYKILSASSYPTMKMAANIAWCHHERWDGGGYPRGLSKQDIPIEARIVSIVDVYDALRSKRPYKPAFSHEKTLDIMLKGDGRTEPEHFDPELLEIFKNRADEFAQTFAVLSDDE